MDLALSRQKRMRRDGMEWDGVRWVGRVGWDGGGVGGVGLGLGLGVGSVQIRSDRIGSDRIEMEWDGIE